MERVKQEFLDLSDKFFDRFTARLEGLTDEEYFWQPAPDCWSIVPGPDGRLVQQWGVTFDEAPPLTTIAWRYTHIIDLFQEERCARNLGLEPEDENIFADGAPRDAASARAMFDKSFGRWKRYLTATDEATIFEPMGPVARGNAAARRATFILHIIDEAIHHGAEIGVLRDLYRTERIDDERLIVLRGEADDATVARMRSDHPDLIRVAGELARWEVIPRLIEAGFDVGTEGRTALHHAALTNRVDMVRMLIDAGASLDARDPQFNATPLEWAQYMDQRGAIEVLRQL